MDGRLQNDGCVICCQDSQFYCMGHCDHPICLECGIRLRVICESSECPICRVELNNMVVISEKAPQAEAWPAFDEVRAQITVRCRERFGFAFEDERALEATCHILSHVCTVCVEKQEFRTFDDLRHHMRGRHQLLYCNLCVVNLKLFSWERKCYTSDQLVRHNREGDPHDPSYNAHPVCEFCDLLHFDDDQLYKHMRKDHFFCHLCDAEGKNIFFADWPDLKEHSKAEHFLCEKGTCKHELLGVCFANRYDLEEHQMQEHTSKSVKRYVADFPVLNGMVAEHGSRKINVAASLRCSDTSAIHQPQPVLGQSSMKKSCLPNGFSTAIDAGAKKSNKTFVVIDDDEEFPSVSEQQRLAQRDKNPPAVLMPSLQSRSEPTATAQNSKPSVSAVVDEIKKTYETVVKQPKLSEAVPEVASVEAKVLRVAEQKQNYQSKYDGKPSSKNNRCVASSGTKPKAAVESEKGLPKSYTAKATSKAATNSVPMPRFGQFVKPQNFDSRNRALLVHLKACMGQDAERIDAFKKHSLDFQRGRLSPSSFCTWMRVLLDDDAVFTGLFNDLVCLLPDIDCQQRLYEAFQETGLRSCEDAVKKCGKCGQWLMKMDFSEHISTAHK